MEYYALCSRSHFRNVNLLFDDIMVVAMEGDEKCLGGPRMHTTPFCFSELHNSHLLHGNSHK